MAENAWQVFRGGGRGGRGGQGQRGRGNVGPPPVGRGRGNQAPPPVGLGSDDPPLPPPAGRGAWGNGPPRGGPSTGAWGNGPPRGPPPTRGPSVGGPPRGAPPMRGLPTAAPRPPAWGARPPTGGPPTGGPPTGGPPTEAPSPLGPPTSGPTACGPPVGRPSPWGPPTGGPPTGAPPTGNGGPQQVTGAMAQMNLSGSPGGRGGATRGRGGRGGQGLGSRSREQETRPRREPNLDEIVDTRPSWPPGEKITKKAVAAKTDVKVRVMTNFFRVKTKNFTVMQWSIQYKSADDQLYQQTGKKRFLLLQHKDKFPEFIFTGDSMYTTTRIQNLDADNKLELTSHEDQPEAGGEPPQPVIITVKYVKDVRSMEESYLQVLNHVNAAQLKSLRLNMTANAFYDVGEKKSFDRWSLEIWPGMSPTIRQFENDLMLVLELRNKVVRKDTAWNTMEQCGSNRIEMKKALIGAVVVTSYNNDKTYRVDDIDFTNSPATKTFEHPNMGKINVVTYFKTKYGINIENKNEAGLLVSMPKKADIRRTGNDEPILLVPELCKMTGLTDRLRRDFKAMEAMACVLKMGPSEKLAQTIKYARRYVEGPTGPTKKILEEWGMEIDTQPVAIDARRLKGESIWMNDKHQNPKPIEYEPGRPDWNFKIKDAKILSPCTLTDWVIILNRKWKSQVHEWVKKETQKEKGFMGVAIQVGLKISDPRYIELNDDNPQTYDAACREVAATKPMFVMVITYNNNTNTIYRVVKNVFMVDYAIPNQVVTLQKVINKNKKGMLDMSKATKVALQVACKLGAVPWSAVEPKKVRLSDTMMVGYDTFHNRGANKKSIGALVASYDPYWTKYYSTTSINVEQNELSQTMDTMLWEAIINYANRNNHKLPSRIFFYRDGVGEGQLQYVKEIEVERIRNMLKKHLPADRLPLLTFIVVSKRIKPRFFMTRDGATQNVTNPPGGTVVDDVVTHPNRHDFYLVSQKSDQGTVNPTSFNIIHDDNKKSAAVNQAMAYLLTHHYYNFAGTIRVPAPCQLAHKLAYMIGEHELRNPKNDPTFKGTQFYL